MLKGKFTKRDGTITDTWLDQEEVEVEAKLRSDIEAYLRFETDFGDFKITGTIKGSDSERGIPKIAAEIARLVTLSKGAAERHIEEKLPLDSFLPDDV